MPTKRTPIGRTPIPQIMPRAIELFDAMRRCRCTCPPHRNPLTRCSACDRWWQLQNQLCDELRTRPWEYPCIEDPREADGPDDRPEAQERWRLLAEASREAKRQERAARRAKDVPEQPTPPSAS